MSTMLLSQAVYNTFGNLSWNTVALILPINQSVTQSYSFSNNFIGDALTYLERGGVQIKNKSEVIDFLSSHSGIVSFLYKLPLALSSFSSDSWFDLQLASERNADGINTKDLLLTIHTNKTLVEAKSSLSALERKWLFTVEDPDISLFSFSLRLN